MLTSASGHLLPMSIVAGGLVLLLRQSDGLAQKYLTANVSTELWKGEVL
jgi:hypothetical protein